MRFDLPEDVERSRRWLRGVLVRLAVEVHPDAEPVLTADPGPQPVEDVPDDQPGRYRCDLRIEAAPPVELADNAAPIRRAGMLLEADGWSVAPLRAESGRYEVVARKAGATIVAASRDGEGILRLSARTPAFTLPPVVPPAPPAGPLDAPGDWVPANDVEAGLLAARRRGDQGAFFELLRTAPLYLPRQGSDDRFVTLTVGERVHLAVFTSPQALRYRAGDAEVLPIDADRLAQHWPDDTWDLAVDPGTPIEVYLPLADVWDAARGRIQVPGFQTGRSEPGPVAVAEAGNDVERRLAAAIAADDRDAVLDVLAGATPVWVDWRVRSQAGVPSIAVYTSPRRAGADATAATIAEVAAAWPDRSYQMVVNPGSGLAAVLPGFAVWTLAEQTGGAR